MNYNANSRGRHSVGLKAKRVSDVNAMGYNPYAPQQSPAAFPVGVPNTAPDASVGVGVGIPEQSFQPQPMLPQQINNTSLGYLDQAPSPFPNQQYQPNPQQQQYNYDPNMLSNANLGVFAQPVVQNMAMQYGQQLAESGKAMVQQEIHRYIPVSHLKYYFAVDTNYVTAKLRLLLFPFTHKDWSLKYEQNGRPVQPRYELNAPDLYIPTMAYVTYVLVAGLALGMHNKFSPEQISIQSSSALAWCIVELALYSCALYIANITTQLRTLDLLAFSSYKFVGIILSVLTNLAAGKIGYYVVLGYSSLALAFYLTRSLKAQIHSNADHHQGGYKRRLYFLFAIAIIQPVTAWWLSFHLIN